MMSEFYAEIYPVITIKGKDQVRRFVCNGVRVAQREGCIVLWFEVLGGDDLCFWGDRSHEGVLPALEYFQKTGVGIISRSHALDHNVVEEFKRVLDFFDEPVNLKGLLPEKKVV
ncbi:hypothetical protein phiA829_138 [Aeromonas phage phiA8-29]|uniref:Uncharacterized protein n=1 Tax=Aeromonas phage phiA8-29 TaxID=1978922 RepID=A0A1W6DYH6_9CAUD|nr:hypothetical protein HWB15_gp139 [Aeromonas phage phiA8-29]ARK07958.1 hypothetical protein phiA829_138 [Aeromonas phage phiA8-29]